MADRISIYKAKTNSFFEDIYIYLEFRGWTLSERRLDICIFQITLVSLQIMPGKGLPYWKIQESDLVNLYLVTIWQKSGNFKFLKSTAMCVWENRCVPVTDQSKVSYDSYIHTELILGLKTLGTIAVLRGMGLICYFTALKYYWY